ncbi:hypothetical protein O9G_002678 [Rozella allomycis CSF55]|uniref:Uncharacterized protein n=1 Tax=Rozella allomycis (strain CSF55) TaxID=988480 RepID=A0A075B456_ROZAC|nr:hypothetical protein O9G_002678 [Rozella allomycis CSF55]|eukprot:EPZ36035.1 hypothetical protein O9G_002678 [Rozella allomycis CSF55]
MAVVPDRNQTGELSILNAMSMTKQSALLSSEKGTIGDIQKSPKYVYQSNDSCIYSLPGEEKHKNDISNNQMETPKRSQQNLHSDPTNISFEKIPTSPSKIQSLLGASIRNSCENICLDRKVVSRRFIKQSQKAVGENFLSSSKIAIETIKDELCSKKLSVTADCMDIYREHCSMVW